MKHSIALRYTGRCLLVIVIAIYMPTLQAQTPDTKINIRLKGAGLEEFIRTMENSTGYSFIYGESVKLDRRITMDVKGRSVRQVLSLAFRKEPITFSFSGKHILLQVAKEKPSNRKFTISGLVTDGLSEETLIGANIYEDRYGMGTTTNSYGFFSITLPEGETELRFSYIGYGSSKHPIKLCKDTVLNIRLREENQLQEIIILSDKSETGNSSTHTGAMDIPLTHIRNTPSFLGESDVLKSIQLLPGIQAGTEGTAGLHVRGGGPDQNLILLDGVPMYNVEHLFGFFSIFTPEAVKKVNLFKSSFPARFGGRLSSVIDVRTNDGDMQKFHGSFSIGLLSSKLHFEGPIIKNRTSFHISMRRSYIDLLMKPFLARKESKGGYRFYDVNAKINHKFSDRSRLFLSTYQGNDAFNYSYEQLQYENTYDTSTLDWGSRTYAARWNFLFNSRLFSNTTLAYNTYRLRFKADTRIKAADYDNSYNATFSSGIKDWSYNIDFDYTPTPFHHIKFGGNYLFHFFHPEVMNSRVSEKEGTHVSDTTYNTQGSSAFTAHEASLYAEDDWKLSDRLRVNAGLHFSLFQVQKKSYLSAQPRLSLRYELTGDLTLKASYSRMNQYIHLLSSSAISTPMDLWVPVTKQVKPMIANQYSVGLYYAGIRGWEFSMEGYYKGMKNVLEYKDGATFLGSSSGWEDKVEMGKGRSFGIEWMVQKTLGKTTGWISYTLAKADRQFSVGGINSGNRFPYKYDRRHNISVTLNHKFSNRIDVSASWVFSTGNTTTLSREQTAVVRPEGTDYYTGDYLGTMTLNNSIITEGSLVKSRNNYRLPVSHRLNLGVNFRKKTKHGERIWNVGLYNAYNAMNPNLVYWKTDKLGEHKLTKITILPCIPSFSYTYKF